ncbi:MAG: LytTR family DNA-binding domain-containing protein [Phenylobacterium sp.]|uniref:LytTR family DNA-binding domain-containing protein n=1 Tax=Phenylobacterium sp. TaxID=1871053 RepID=UPI0027329B92|nr:LytTR family DNA-binding domain-containing protein [Phenylobacterium sp.]MDP3749410.1 LytTR family DNA-binding domain-containing protein [Phenylobacterium sp.]
MTNGDQSGTDRIFWRALPLFAVAIFTLNTINTFTAIQDRPDIPWIYPAVSQATSAVTAVASIWIAWLAYRIAPVDSRPRWRVLVVHALALLGFSAFHVVGFYYLRMLAFGLLDLPYQYDLPGRFIYELRKDAFGYVVGTTAFWGMTRLYGQASSAGEGPATFDIRDGARVIRVALADILAVSSAGNYVEFALADGRKPLMRSSLSAVEAELGPRGFVRTHRSWLVNVARVTELRPEKSGDYSVALGPVEAPLSRRFPEALARLRAG